MNIDKVDVLFGIFTGTLFIMLVLMFSDTLYHHWYEQHIEQECTND